MTPTTILSHGSFRKPRSKKTVRLTDKLTTGH